MPTPPLEGRVVALEAFCSELTEIVCDADTRCCSDDSSPVDEHGPVSCRVHQGRRCMETVGAILADPRTGYVPERGGAYLDELRRRGAECFAEPPRLEALTALFEGTGVEGADCSPPSLSLTHLFVSQSSCEDGLTCRVNHRSDGSLMGVCEAREDGGACSHPLDCLEGQFCNLPEGWELGAWGVCQPFKVDGWACVRDQECVGGSCREGACAHADENTYCDARGYSGEVMAAEPVAYWRLGDVGTTLTDEAQGFDGTVSGEPMRVEGALVGDDDGAMALDMTSPGATFPDLSTMLDGAQTLEVWFLRAEGSGPGPLIEIGLEDEARSGRLWANGEGGVDVYANFPDAAGANRDITGPGLVAADTWYHVVATHDGESLRLYLDGALVGAIDEAYELPEAGPIRVGYREGDERHLVGALDEVAIYPRALTPEEIRSHATTGHLGPQAQPFPLFRWLTP